MSKPTEKHRPRIEATTAPRVDDATGRTLPRTIAAEGVGNALCRDLLLRGVYEITTLSAVEWFAELTHALLPEASLERAEVERALATREAVIRDADAAVPLLDFNWAPPLGSPMDRIIDRLQRRGPRLVPDSE